MNRHERRKVKIFETKRLSVAELSAAWQLCAWNGCQAAFKGDMPRGWTNLLMFWSPGPALNFFNVHPGDWLRDTALCPQHTRLMNSQLKELGSGLSGPAAGNA
jgi:hypothetical protein